MEDKREDIILSIRGMSKSFGRNRVLDHINLDVKRGTVMGLMGENGAGKSTMMKCLFGTYQKDEGNIYLDGKEVNFSGPKDALENGIAMVHQELDLIPEMTVEENVFAGREKSNGIVIDKRGMEKRTKDLMESLGIDISPKTKIKELSTAQQQMVAITRALAFDAEIIIMDEPTSAITDREVEQLFKIIRKLKTQGKAIVYISHKMDEIYSLTDQITVFRDGCLIGSVATKDVTPEKLINMMVGRELKDVYDKSSPKTADYDENEVLLKVENLTRENEFYNINFEVKRGEILGFFGLMGAGRTEVMDTVFGLRKAEKGTVTMKGNQMGTVKKAISNGMAYITEDRKISGLNLIASVKDNISIAYMDMITKGKFLIDFKKEKEISDELIKKIKIKCSSRDTLAGTLSGGNQQKIVIAKWFMGNPDLLIMDEPTRGIDIGAKAEIYKLMDMLVKSGKSIIMISSETPELLGMSDRVIVMHEGYQTGEFKCGELNQDKLMAYAIGEGGKYHQ